jgi:hypothetical protein
VFSDRRQLPLIEMELILDTDKIWCAADFFDTSSFLGANLDPQSVRQKNAENSAKFQNLISARWFFKIKVILHKKLQHCLEIEN